MNKLPTHLAFIVDGNRRWARERSLPTLEGHRRGFSRVETVIDEVARHGIPFTSFYLFSTENWNRSPEEVAYLMDLIRHNLDRLTKKMLKLNLRCLWLGREERVAPDLIAKLRRAEAETAANADAYEAKINSEAASDSNSNTPQRTISSSNAPQRTIANSNTPRRTAGTICICFNYGGQQEIADACTQILREYQQTSATSAPSTETPATPDTEPPTAEKPAKTPVQEPPLITPAALAAHLYHPEVPPCDLIVRTSGEERISGFMLWRAAYSEFLFLEKYFPDITPADVDAVLAEYSSRQRRFGK